MNRWQYKLTSAFGHYFVFCAAISMGDKALQAKFASVYPFAGGFVSCEVCEV